MTRADDHSSIALGDIDDLLLRPRRKLGDDHVIDFLADLSRSILKSKACRSYPDVMTFGYFCRRSSIESFLQRFPESLDRIGWGMALHIPPSNIPMNFAFSFVFGLVSGNNNLIRLPNNNWHQVALLMDQIADCFGKEQYRDLAAGNLFIRTPRDDHRIKYAVRVCDALLVWGSDETVAVFRQFEKKPRCVEVYFPNRISTLVIDSKFVVSMTPDKLARVAKSFFNDTFLVDNNACSSPGKIFWIGSEKSVDEAQSKFWSSVKNVIDAERYELDVVTKLDRYLDVMAHCQNFEKHISVNMKSSNVWTSEGKNTQFSGRFGLFYNAEFQSLDKALLDLSADEQTLTYLGVDPIQLQTTLRELDIVVDRVVPLGRALDIGFIWDGINIPERLSRILEVNEGRYV